MTVGDVIGMVFLDHFDRGLVVTTFEASLVDQNVGEGVRQVYALNVSGVVGPDALGGKVPIYLRFGDDPYRDKIYPSVVVKRGNATPDPERGPFHQIVAKKPAPGAVQVGSGWSSYIYQYRAEPYTISYDVVLMARTEAQSRRLLSYFLRKCRAPEFSMALLDSKGERRLYSCVGPTVSNISEIIDVASKVIGWSISFDVKGELDVVLDAEEKSVLLTEFEYRLD